MDAGSFLFVYGINTVCLITVYFLFDCNFREHEFVFTTDKTHGSMVGCFEFACTPDATHGSMVGCFRDCLCTFSKRTFESETLHIESASETLVSNPRLKVSNPGRVRLKVSNP